MMLTKKDKEWIRQTIHEEFHDALFREITIVKRARKPDEPEAIQETKTMNLLDLMGEYLPFMEAALRGVQADAVKARNRAIENNERIAALGKTMLSLESSIITMAKFAIALRDTGLLAQLERVVETPLLEIIDGSDSQG